MLYLITGLPGAGKTLHAVSWIPREAAFAGREVYYSGIRDLKLPWRELDKPEDWVDVPDGSVVVIDEAQRFMRVRGAGAKVPAHIEALETHRHRGLDIVIITQHANLLDTNVRRLIGHHRHVRRTWGMQTAKLFTWDRVGDSESRTDLVEAQSSRWQYDKAAFAAYHSAEVHTHKVRLPKRVFLALGLVLLFAALVYNFASWVNKKTASPKKEEIALTAGALTPVSTSVKQAAPATYEDYAKERRPVAPEDVASSARYWPLTTVTRAPRVAGCVRSADRCQCFTQSATLVQTSDLQCAEIMANRHFQDWGPGGESGWGDPPRLELAGASDRPAEGAGRSATGAPAAPPKPPAEALPQKAP